MSYRTLKRRRKDPEKAKKGSKKAQKRPRKGIMIQRNSNVIQIGLKKAQKRSRKCPEMAQNRLKIGSK